MMQNKYLQKIVSFFAVAVMLLAMFPLSAVPVAAATTEFAGGSGTAVSPYLISTKEHLDNVRNNLSAHYKMIADIAFTESDFAVGGAFYNNGKGWNMIGAQSQTAFTGVFDGNGCTISNLQITISTTDSWASYKELHTGLFGYVKGTIKSLTLDNIVNSTYDHYHKIHVGGIAGYSTGTIENVTVNGVIEARSGSGIVYVGGISGTNNGSILGAHVEGNISGTSIQSEVYAAGITGYATYTATSITTSSNTASVRASSAGTTYAAGISACNGTITNCYNDGDINGKCSGGIGGWNCTILQCYNTGSITGTTNAGGIQGKGTSTSDCYNIGDVYATTYAGGIVGLMGGGQLQNCYNLGKISGATYLGSIVGGNHGTVYSEDYILAGGTISNCYYPSTHTRGVGRGTGSATSKSISDLKKQSTFTNFDFSKVWTTGGNANYFYPELKNNYLHLTVTAFRISSLPQKKTYLEGKDQLTLTGAKGLATYDSGFSDSIDITANMVTGFDNTLVGTQVLTVSFGGKRATFTVEITPKKLTSITLNTPPNLTSYTEGIGILDLSGATILLSYNNSTSNIIDITADMVSGFDNTITGNQVVTVTHEGFSTTFNVTILEKTIEKIEILSLPSKLNYICMSEHIDVTGGMLIAEYNNGTSEQIPLNDSMVLSYDNTKLGPQNITISYGGIVTSFEVIFVENTRDYSGGIGTAENPYLIATKEHLNNVRNHLGAHYKLIRDIEFDDSDFTSSGIFYNSGKGWRPIGDQSSTPFTGVFDGNNYSIINLQIYDSQYNNRDTGLFGFNSGTIRNLTLMSSRISTKSYPCDVGSIVGQNNAKGILEYCSSRQNTITSTSADNLGGIVGYNEGTVRYCSNESNVTSSTSAYAGGICGNNSGNSSNIALIQNCFNRGNVILGATSQTGSRVGGIAGRIGSYGTVESSYNTGYILVDAKSTLVGGLSGELYGTIQQCYNTGAVTVTTSSTLYAGGLVGLNNSGQVTNSYNTASVSGSCSGYSSDVFVGGIVGKQSSTLTTSNCYSTGSLAGEGSASRSYVGYICGYNATSTIENCYYLGIADNGSGFGDCSTMYGHSASALKDKSTYQDFDFKTVWTMGGDKYYPFPELLEVPMVYEKEVVSISIASLPEKLDYTDGDTVLDLTGGKINVTYLYNVSELVDFSNATIIGFDNKKIGVHTLTVAFAGKTTTFDISVTPEPNHIIGATGKCETCGKVLVDFAIDTVVLRAGVAGIYFKSSYAINSSVKTNRYGIAVSLYNPLPVADDSDKTSLWTTGTNSALISNILDGGTDDIENTLAVIYARAYVQLEDGTYIYSDTVAVSLLQVLTAIDSQWDMLTTVQKETFLAMYNTFKSSMSIWDLPRIKEELA